MTGHTRLAGLYITKTDHCHRETPHPSRYLFLVWKSVCVVHEQWDAEPRPMQGALQTPETPFCKEPVPGNAGSQNRYALLVACPGAKGRRQSLISILPSLSELWSQAVTLIPELRSRGRRWRDWRDRRTLRHNWTQQLVGEGLQLGQYSSLCLTWNYVYFVIYRVQIIFYSTA